MGKKPRGPSDGRQFIITQADLARARAQQGQPGSGNAAAPYPVLEGEEADLNTLLQGANLAAPMTQQQLSEAVDAFDASIPRGARMLLEEQCRRRFPGYPPSLALREMVGHLVRYDHERLYPLFPEPGPDRKAVLLILKKTIDTVPLSREMQARIDDRGRGPRT